MLLITIAFADENKVGNYNVGAAAGFVTGYGLSFRQWFNRNGYQVTFSPYYAKDGNQSSTNVSLGLVGLRIFHQANFINLIGYYGGQYIYNSSSFSKTDLLFLGGGPGLDFHFWKMSFNLMFGLAYHTDFSNSSGVNFTGETALYYSF